MTHFATKSEVAAVTRSLKEIAERLRLVEVLPRNAVTTVGGAGDVTEGPGIDIPPGTAQVGVGEDSILLIDNNQQPAFEYPWGQTGLSQALLGAGSGDQVRLQGVGTIGGNHTVKSGVELSGLGRNTYLSGTITNNGTVHDLRIADLQNGVSGRSFNVTTTTENIIVFGLDQEIDNAGSLSVIVGGDTNIISGDHLYNFIGGGSIHEISTVFNTAYFNVIVGGDSNTMQDGAGGWGNNYCVIGGGRTNIIQDATYTVIAGGRTNRAIEGPLVSTPDYGVISGGQNNTIFDSIHATISGGVSNTLGLEFAPGGAADQCTIGGGQANAIDSCIRSTISGGYLNGIDEDYGFVGGGEENTIAPQNHYATIGGGSDNRILRNVGSTRTNLWANTIAGGRLNDIRDGYACFIGGGENHDLDGITTDASGWSAIVAGNSHDLIDSDYATIVGGDRNQIHHGCDYGFIGGGSQNDLGVFGSKDSLYSAIVGGLSNIIYDGDYNIIVGGRSNFMNFFVAESYVFMGGGQANTVDGAGWATLVGGFTNNIDTAEYASVLGGRENQIYVNGDYGAILGGYLAYVDKYGQQAHAAGQFSGAGDAQRSEFVARRSVTHSDANWYELYLDGTTAGLLTIIQDTVWAFTVRIAGTTQGCTESFDYEIKGTIENDGGTTTILAQTVTNIYEDTATFDVRVSADDTNDALLVEVSDSASGGSVVRWVATIRTAEVRFPA